jgi:hypothetical protein
MDTAAMSKLTHAALLTVTVLAAVPFLAFGVLTRRGAS